MYTVIVIIALVAFAGWCIQTSKHHFWNRQNMFCYFEWMYNGEIGTSREYGPMQEIDAVGAMQYRESLGAQIIYKVFKSDPEDVHDIIDQRYYEHQAMSNRNARTRS